MRYRLRMATYFTVSRLRGVNPRTCYVFPCCYRLRFAPG
uniref:Cuticle protein n=1 Tax=Podoviridae sp. ctnCN2 TaxID=2825274 RepID=A0A8S5PLC1_9CAUD|nr:MAG TPA: cuticle protein [Podoviridae sp. ctnCN2]